MVADLTRYSACRVHADKPDRPVRIRKAGDETLSQAQPMPSEQKAPPGDQPVRLFAWVSA